MLRDPEQHKQCPKNFTGSECPCDCGHPGEKPVERLKAKEVGTRAQTRRKKADSD